MVFGRLNKKVQNIALAFALFGFSIFPQIANVASVSAQSANSDININASFDPNITPTQRTLLIKAIRNWDSIITRDMVNQGRVNIYIRNGNMTQRGNHWAETSTPTDGSRPRFRPIYSNGYHAMITFKSGISLNSNTFTRLATHELGHAMFLNEAQNEPSLGTNGIMHSTGLYQFIPEGTYRKLEWLGYSVNRNPALQW
jgi:hypothetical protein